MWIRDDDDDGFDCIPQHFFNKSSLCDALHIQTKPVWLTLFPLIAGGCLWAGYVSTRTLFGHNEIVYALPFSSLSPPLSRELPQSCRNARRCVAR
jgi:hypothetical protein